MGMAIVLNDIVGPTDDPGSPALVRLVQKWFGQHSPPTVEPYGPGQGGPTQC